MPPDSATTDRNNLCAADGSIVLSYSGGNPGTNATAEWYTDAACTAHAGTGIT